MSRTNVRMLNEPCTPKGKKNVGDQAMPSVRHTDRRRAAASHCRDEIYFRLTLSNLTGCTEQPHGLWRRRCWEADSPGLQVGLLPRTASNLQTSELPVEQREARMASRRDQINASSNRTHPRPQSRLSRPQTTRSVPQSAPRWHCQRSCATTRRLCRSGDHDIMSAPKFMPMP